MPQLILSTGLRLAYEHYGDRGGAPAFYFHGWPSSGLQGGLMDAAGKRLGVHFVAMDRPGIGGSDFQKGRRLLDWPPVLAELADDLSWPRFHLFGVSGGGPYALVTAYGLPDRVLSTSVVCGAPPLRLFGPQDLFLPYRVALLLRRSLPWALAPLFRAGALVSRLPSDRWPMTLALRLFNPADRAALMDPLCSSIFTASFRAAAGNGLPPLQTEGDVYTSDWGFNLGDIRSPVQFWHGKADRNIPWTYAQKTAAMVPHAVTHWTENDGHYSMATARVDEIIVTALGRG